MKNLKTIYITFLFVFGTSVFQAQISKPQFKQPKFKPSNYIGHTLPYDEIINAINSGKCFNIALVSLQLNKKNSHENSYNVETHHGKGFIQKDGNNLKSVIPLKIGLKQTRYQQNSVNTTINMSKSKNGARIEIRNSNNYYLFYVDKIEKTKTGYLLFTRQDKNYQTISFTITLFETPCLI
ncbi:MAG: hypothetical protein ACWA42_03825 [Lutibacter sp.]